jgi:ubiquinone/menaquinone biosynthesis C-methylase UbiE
MSTTTIALKIDGVKARLKETWMAGDYDRFSRYMEQGARIFYEQLDVPAGCQLLDVACGSGQVAIWAARDGVNVTGIDIVPNLVQRAQARADAEGLNARFMEGDAEALPFEDASFDVVTSLVGAMFAPRPELVARELLRVCSPGGTIAMGIGRVKVSWDKCSKPSPSSSRPPPCQLRCCGAMRQWYASGPRDFRPDDETVSLQLYLSLSAG